MSKTWFRVHADGPKSITRNRKIQRLPATLFKWVVNLWAFACRNNGCLPPVEDIAFELHVSVSRVSSVVTQLVTKRFIDEVEGCYVMHDWGEHQFESDSSTERVRRFRERKRNVSETPRASAHSGSVSVSGSESVVCSEENQHTPENQSTPLELAIEQTAAAIQARHPAIRRCGISEVRDHLRAIVRKLPAAEKIPKLNAINANHAAWCETEKWTKDGGEFAKGLDNWLAPTKKRYDVPVPSEREKLLDPLEKARRALEESNRAAEAM